MGDYQLDNIRLVDAATGETRMEATPSSVPVHVFDEVLISRVTSRPLTLDEIKEKGIVIDDANFRAVEFEVGFVLDGKSIPVKFQTAGAASLTLAEGKTYRCLVAQNGIAKARIPLTPVSATIVPPVKPAAAPAAPVAPAKRDVKS